MKIFLIVLCSLLAIAALTVAAFLVSPRPSAFLVHQLFRGGVAVPPNDYETYESKVDIHKNLSYSSTYKENKLDVITPKDKSEKWPTIIWIHGGAFVGGDKQDVLEYAVLLASHGYNIISANYELAPSAQYPAPIHQMSDVYRFAIDQSEKFGFDLERIYFAGDSAGAQIASQYALVQTNETYAKQLGIKQTVPADNIKGLLLYCGPYDLSKLALLSDNKLVAFLLDKVGWAYTGERNWVTSEVTKFASTIDFVDENYPPSFITDGNEMTFTDHGVALAEALSEKGVLVQTRFYPREQAILPHEYQFIFDYEEAYETLQATVEFLSKTSK